jgi:hypothetical protein
VNEPAAVTWKLTGAEVVPSGTVSELGEGGVSPKLTMCNTRLAVLVRFESAPSPSTLKL